jgi:uncharacterized protein (DUF433 family)
MAIAFQHLVHDEKNGVTKIAGRRIRVYDVLGYTHEGYTPGEIAEDYHLPLAAVYEALAYAEEHAEEMDELRAREDAAYERIMNQVSPGLRAQVKSALKAEQASGPSLL